MDAGVNGGSADGDAPITDALLLCGGEGSRLRAGGVETEKPLVEVCGTPMLDRVHEALAGSRIERVHAVVSPNAPASRERARDLPCGVIETPGDGYVDDLDLALEEVGEPVLTVAADLPLLAPGVVDRVIDVAGSMADAPGRGGAIGVPSLTACVPAVLKELLDVSVDTTVTPEEIADEPRVAPAEYTGTRLAPTGVNVVGDSAEAIWVSHDVRLTVNVNQAADLDVAESLCVGER